jgi:hypothetical protein
MPNVTDFYRRWEVRPTLWLLNPPDQTALGSIEQIEQVTERVRDTLLQHPSVAVAYVGLESSTHSVGITATIVLAQPSTPGAAVDEAVNLLAITCTVAGLKTDVIKEIVVEMADIDPRSL